MTIDDYVERYCNDALVEAMSQLADFLLGLRELRAASSMATGAERRVTRIVPLTPQPEVGVAPESPD